MANATNKIRAGFKVGDEIWNQLTYPDWPCAVVCGSEFLSGGNSDQGNKNETDGNPDPPCLVLGPYGRFKFRLPVSAGSKSISVDVKQTGTGNLSPVFNAEMETMLQAHRPSLLVYRNLEIGVNENVIAFAATGTGWVTIGPVVIVPSVAGAVIVEFRVNNYRPVAACYWDKFAVT